MEQVAIKLAYQGQWLELLELLERDSSLVNAASEPKGYTPLHQAAWHGAEPAVVGALLTHGGNPALRTLSKSQTPYEIALEKHPAREDLHFLLAVRGRTASQLIRKVIAESRQLFEPYDGNQVVCDRMLDALGSDSCLQINEGMETRLSSAFRAVTGVDWSERRDIAIAVGAGMELHANSLLWTEHFLPALKACSSPSRSIPIERHWATMVDLFYPDPTGWGLRGDPFLWFEMMTALHQVPIPPDNDDVFLIMASLFRVMTGAALSSEAEIHVARFARGGMSSGMVSGRFWLETLIPLVQRRAKWLHEAWRLT